MSDGVGTESSDRPELPKAVLRHRDAALPESWQVVTLGDVLTSISNGLTASQSREGEFPVTRIETIAKDRVDSTRVGYVNGLSDAEVARYRLQPGDILFSHINSEPQIGRGVLYTGEPPFLLHGMNLLRLRVDEGTCDPTFLVSLLAFYRRTGVFRGLAARAVGQASINQGKLRRVAIPLPALGEQRRVAGLTERIQVARGAAEAATTAVRELRRLLREHMFRYGPVPKGRIRTVQRMDSAVGEIPAHWSVSAVSQLGEVVTGTTPPTKERAYYGGPIPFICPGDIGDAKVVATTERYLTEAGLEKARALPSQSVAVVCIGATIGKVALTDADQSATNQQINTVVPGEGVDPNYLYYALEHRASDLPRFASRAAVPIVNKGSFSKFQLPLPPYNEQKDISKVLAAIDGKLEVGKEKVTALDMLHDAVVGAVFAGKLSLTKGGTGA